MNNISLKLALASIKKEKKQYMMSFIVMILSLTAVIAFLNTLYNNQIINQKIREKLYGNWNICYQNITDQDIKMIKDLKDYESLTQVELVGTLDNDSHIANYNKEFFQLAHIELEGSIPQNNDEIIVKRPMGNIGERITLTISGETKSFKIVGLINNYDEKWCIDAYDYFTFQQTPLQYQVFIKGNVKYDVMSLNVNFNYLLDDSIYHKDAMLFKDRNERIQDYYNEISSNEDTSTDNIIIVFSIVGLLVGMSYTMSQRKERLLLLRSLGMTNKQMRGYMFYETLCLAIISLVISLGLGLILSWLMSLILSNLTKQYYFSFHFVYLLRYIGLLFLMILIISYFSYMVISIQSLDSLIHKKRRTKMKKYHKVQKMNVHHLTTRELKYHKGIMSAIIILSICTLTMLTKVVIYINSDIYSHSYDIYGSNYYEYNLKINQKFDFSDYSINGLNERQICDAYSDRDYVSENEGDVFSINHIITCDQFDSSFLEERTLQGRMPEQINECVVKYWGPKESGDKKYYEVGDTVTVQDDGNNHTINYQVVGVIFDNEYLDYSIHTDDFYLQIETGDYFIVFEQSIPENEWKYFYSFVSNKDLTTRFDQDFETIFFSYRYENGSYTKSQIIDFVYSMIIIFVGFIFLIVMIQIFIEKVLKDLKLLRCLGMTHKQALKMSVYIYGYCLLINMIWFMIYFCLIEQPFTDMMQVFMFYNSFLFVVFISITYYKLKKQSSSFLPSDVKRYY